MERAEGIEPSSVAWKATALPLCYARIAYKVACRLRMGKLARSRRDPHRDSVQRLAQVGQDVVDMLNPNR